MQCTEVTNSRCEGIEMEATTSKDELKFVRSTIDGGMIDALSRCSITQLLDQQCWCFIGTACRFLSCRHLAPDSDRHAIEIPLGRHKIMRATPEREDQTETGMSLSHQCSDAGRHERGFTCCATESRW